MGSKAVKTRKPLPLPHGSISKRAHSRNRLISDVTPPARYSFADFPQRIRAILDPSGIGFEPVVYPPFDTRGELRVAGELLSLWISQARVEPDL